MSGRLQAVLGRLEAVLPDQVDAPVRVADLARAVGVSTRTLYRAAAARLGAPPITRLRDLRLDRVRSRLLAATPGDTVTSAATDSGFFHLGSIRRYFGDADVEFVLLEFWRPFFEGLANEINEWVVFATSEGTIQSAYDYWILGKGAEATGPRWSILRNVLGWGK